MSATWPTAAEGSSALRGISLQVARGERVGLVGPSGSGKSTLAAVMMGFLPYDGTMTVSGVDVRGVAGDDLRGSIGLLSQQAHMFDTTIADNVRLGDPSASDDEVAAALATAQLTDWIATLPNGTDTQVGVAGIAVSGGERQRLALARLLLARRPFVILDEPTEHLDATTAAALAVTLAEALRDSTVLVVTHRLSDLVDVDRIIELRDGEVTASGTHDELLRAGGWYAQQWYVESDRRQMAELLDGLPVGFAVAGPADRDR